ncbi:MAG: GTP pyrophosphokinase family protein [Lachnospiraceae bacterium]|nr:GTP pyrophosphokinase family protein [Lachnospiraceae bacterium]
MNSIYGTYRPELERTREFLIGRIEEIRSEMKSRTGGEPIEHLLSRVKSEESMREKCVRKGLPETPESALFHIYDAIGIRIVCSFINDIQKIRDRIAELPGCRVVREKDYIRKAKPNGYRSYHMVIQTDTGIYAEIQLRTISMDTWAALEHHMKYKKKLNSNLELITSELKRCADELASTDLSMQILHDMIYDEGETTP